LKRRDFLSTISIDRILWIASPHRFSKPVSEAAVFLKQKKEQVGVTTIGVRQKNVLSAIVAENDVRKPPARWMLGLCVP
jgi:hypothetical protein